MKYFFEASETGARRPVDVCFARTGVERRRSSQMPQAAFYGDGRVPPTSRKSLSCHESTACRRVGSKKIVQNLEELSIDFVRFLE